MTHVTSHHDNILHFTAKIDGFDMNNISINGFSIDILFLEEFKVFQKSNKGLKKIDLKRFVEELCSL